MKNLLLFIIGILVTAIIIVITPDFNSKPLPTADNKKLLDSLNSCIVEKDIEIGKYQIVMIKLQALHNADVDSIISHNQ